MSEARTVRVNEVDLSIVDTGSGLPVLVFLHYYGGSSRTWDPVMKELAETHRCVAIDFRGWGRSDKSSNDYDLETLASDVESVVEAIGLSEYILIGHSMGGKVAQIVAARQPNGLKGLVLVAPAPPGPLEMPADEREGIVSNYCSRAGVETVIGILTSRPLTSDQREQVIEDTLASPLAAKRAWPDSGMAKDIRSRARQVVVPIRVVVGENDIVETESALRTAFGEFYPAADFVVIPGTGHLAPLEAPSAVVDAIRTAPIV